MTKPLPKFVIVIDGKPFLKFYDKGEVPDVRIDFEFKKAKMTRYKMGCLNKPEAEDLVTQILEVTDDDGWSGLTPEEKKKIITGIVSTHLC